MGKNIDSPSELHGAGKHDEKRTEKDDDEYFQFTGTARYDKTIHSLEGLVNGIAIDGKVNDSEINALRYWIDKNNDHSPIAGLLTLSFNVSTNVLRTMELWTRKSARILFGAATNFRRIIFITTKSHLTCKGFMASWVAYRRMAR